MSVVQSYFLYMLVYIWTCILAHYYQKKNVEKYAIRLDGLGGWRLSVIHKIPTLRQFVIINVAIIIMAAIRYDVGIDWSNYSNYYKAVGKMDIREGMDSHTFEAGYRILNVLTAGMFHTVDIYNIGIFLTSTVLLMYLVYFLLRQYKDELSYAMLYCCFFTICFHPFLNVLRQEIAVMLMLVAARYLYQFDWKKYILLCMLAISIHISAIIWGIVLWILWSARRTVRKYLQIWILISILSPLWVLSLRRIIIYTILKIAPKYAHLAIGEGDAGIGYYLYIIPPLLLLAWLYGKEIYHNERYSFMYMLIWLQLPIQSLGMLAKDIGRMSLYPSAMQVLLIPLLLNDKQSFHKEKYFVFIMWQVFRLLIMEFCMIGNGTSHYMTVFG